MCVCVCVKGWSVCVCEDVPNPSWTFLIVNSISFFNFRDISYLFLCVCVLNMFNMLRIEIRNSGRRERSFREISSLEREMKR